MKHMDYLDGWRGLAIGGVLISHFLSIPGFSSGRFGVDMFFVLSGVLMSRILFEDRTPLGIFYRRRISRIVPVFLLFCFAVFIMSRAMAMQWTPMEIASSLVFLRTYYMDIEIWNTAVPAGHFWSLNVEEHSYMFLALIAAVPFLRKREGWFLLSVAALCVFAIIWYWKHPLTRPTDDYMLRTECAALGLLLSAGYRQIRHNFQRWVRPWMPVVALLIGAACYLWTVPGWMKGLVAPFFLAFSVNHIGETYRVVLRAFEWKPLRMLGIWSYSIYLWQQPFYELAKDGKLAAAIALPLAIGVGLLSFYFYEKPTRDWLNRNWARKPARAIPVAVSG